VGEKDGSIVEGEEDGDGVVKKKKKKRRKVKPAEEGTAVEDGGDGVEIEDLTQR
jgi:hypothetical protein